MNNEVNKLEGIRCEKVDNATYELKSDDLLLAKIKRIGDSWLVGLWYNNQWVDYPTLYGALSTASMVAWVCTVHNLLNH